VPPLYRRLCGDDLVTRVASRRGRVLGAVARSSSRGGTDRAREGERGETRVTIKDERIGGVSIQIADIDEFRDFVVLEIRGQGDARA
jgi:hypothetical protein